MGTLKPTTVQERIGRVVDVAQTAGWTTTAYRRGTGYALRCLKGANAFVIWFGPKGSINLAWHCWEWEVAHQIHNGPGSPRSWGNVVRGGKDVVLRELRSGVKTMGDKPKPPPPPPDKDTYKGGNQGGRDKFPA